MPEYKCGCVNEPHEPSGILHCVRKCAFHAVAYRDPATLDESYYAEFGLVKGGRIVESPHVGQLVEALGPLPTTDAFAEALEVGCGVSPYFHAILDAGWNYFGVDACPWVCRFMAGLPGANIIVASWDDWRPVAMSRFILCAHALEHLHDAPRGIVGLARSLEPGGELRIVVPDDTDPVNPDHWWMFRESTLRSAIEAAGLVVERIATRRYVAHENFLYARARRPG